jgi:hypothetical protein
MLAANHTTVACVVKETVHSLRSDIVTFDYVLLVGTDFTPNVESIIIFNSNVYD